MSKDDDHKYGSLVIPTYEEATSSRPHSSQSHREESGPLQDAERQGLLGRSAEEARDSQRRHGSYRQPTVESARTSYDSDLTMPEVSSDEEEEEALRHDMEQMEVVDSEAERRAQQRARIRLRFSKGLASITDKFSSIHLPTLPVSFPSFAFLTSRLPTVSERLKPSWPIILRLIALSVIASLVYGVFVIRVFSPKRVNLGKQYVPETFRAFVQSQVDPERIEGYLREITADDHVAGTKGSFFLAQWIRQHFEAAKLDNVWTEE